MERVVPESAMETHEESAERFLVLSGVLLVVAAAGLLPRVIGQSARLVTAVGAVGLIVAAAQVGHSGGSLVYQHGAASAYATGAGTTGGGDGAATRGGDDDDR